MPNYRRMKEDIRPSHRECDHRRSGEHDAAPGFAEGWDVPTAVFVARGSTLFTRQLLFLLVATPSRKFHEDQIPHMSASSLEVYDHG